MSLENRQADDQIAVYGLRIEPQVDSIAEIHLLERPIKRVDHLCAISLAEVAVAKLFGRMMKGFLGILRDQTLPNSDVGDAVLLQNGNSVLNDPRGCDHAPLRKIACGIPPHDVRLHEDLFATGETLEHL